MKRRIEIRNHQRERYFFQLRLIISAGFVVLLMLVLVSRFFYLQVLRHDYFTTMAENNRISVMPIVPNRGLILDRNGEVLARNYSGYTLEITPSKVDDLEATIDQLAKIIDIGPRDRKRFKKLRAESRSFTSLPIRSRLSDEEVARFAAQSYRFPGVDIKARLFREYPYNEITSHLIGYIGRINDRDLKRLDQEDLLANYRGSDYIGKSGIEQSYETELHGSTGFEQMEVDAGGRGVRVLSRTPPVSGQTLQLTLDIKLQEIAEKAFGHYRGALVAIDPNNGEILAFVSRPGYDPNLFIDGIDTDSWNALNNSLDVPLLNRVLHGQYPPGSTLKPFIALASLNSGTHPASYTINDPGYFMLPGSSHQYRDWKSGGHGKVDLFRAIQQSCDTYFYGLATDMGIDVMHDFLARFGFGKKTGIDMNGELSGLLPSQEWKQRRYHQPWYPGDTVSAGIGQGYTLVTPMQLAYATATLADNGIAHRPHVVKELIGADGKGVPVQQPGGIDLQLKQENLDLVRRAMIAVTKPGGTAVSANYGTPYDIAGKTGTAQVVTIKQGEKYDASQLSERNRDHAWFMAYAPAEKPKIAVAVLVENGGHGGATAAPIARQVFDYYLLRKVPRNLPALDVKQEEEND